MTPIERDHGRGLNGALAAEIRAELAVQEKTLTWLSAAAGIERLTLRRYIKAERAMNTALIEAIALALQMDPGELMARAVERRNKYPELYGPDATPARSADDDAEADRAVARLDRRTRETRPARARAETQSKDEAAHDEGSIA